MTSPVGENPPASVAVSVIWPPTGTVGEAWVTRVGRACVTTTDSPASLHGALTGALIPSPRYDATHR